MSNSDSQPVPTHGQAAGSKPVQQHHQDWWLWVMCLCAVDYMSTMGYFPSIGYEGLGKLLPLATIKIVILTMLGVLPLYMYVAKHSPHGEGSIKMIERLFIAGGWLAKAMIMVLCGFAATDFILTITLSAADASAHLIGNPIWPRMLEAAAHPFMLVADVVLAVLGFLAWKRGYKVTANTLLGLFAAALLMLSMNALSKDWQQIVLTEAMVLLLGLVFWVGFREAIVIAKVIVGVYLTLNLIVIGSCAVYLLMNPECLQQWWIDVTSGNWHVDADHMPFGVGPSLSKALLTVAILFPLLALGLSGFETGTAVMPLVRGKPDDDPEFPAGRIAATRKLLFTAAAIMSVMLIGGSFAVATLIPHEAFHGAEPTAKDRALAYIAHGQTGLSINPLFGPIFGTIYDFSTVMILWFAGASAFAGLMNLIPRYLPRFGMAPEWSAREKPLVVTITAIAAIVTLIFGASVDAQGDAYATGVLALMASASIAVLIGVVGSTWKAETRKFVWFVTAVAFLLVTVALVYMFVFVVWRKPVGLKIATVFILVTLAVAILSRVWRATELRHKDFLFKDETHRMLWTDLCSSAFKVLVPHRPNGRSLADKEREVRARHRIPDEVQIVFLEVYYGDPSEFHNSPIIEVNSQDERFIIIARECVSVSHTVAQVALELSKGERPVDVIFGWSEGNPINMAISFVMFGQGDVPIRVRDLLKKAVPDDVRRPTVIVG